MWINEIKFFKTSENLQVLVNKHKQTEGGAVYSLWAQELTVSQTEVHPEPDPRSASTGTNFTVLSAAFKDSALSGETAFSESTSGSSEKCEKLPQREEKLPCGGERDGGMSGADDLRLWGFRGDIYLLSSQRREGPGAAGSANQHAASAVCTEDWLLLLPSSLLMWTVTDVGHAQLRTTCRSGVSLFREKLKLGSTLNEISRVLGLGGRPGPVQVFVGNVLNWIIIKRFLMLHPVCAEKNLKDVMKHMKAAQEHYYSCELYMFSLIIVDLFILCC